MQNTAARDSTTKESSPSSSPQRPPTTVGDHTDATHSSQTTVGGRGRGDSVDNVRMIPWQVRELITSGSSGSTGGDDGGSGSSSAVAGAVAVGGSGGSTMAVEVAGGSVGKPMLVGEGVKRKRKPSEVRDPPPGAPSCHICHQEFKSWKAAFGHMRKHPREYRGFFGPPSFSVPSSPSGQQEVPVQADAGEGGESTGEGGLSPTRGLPFDLNQPVEGVEYVSPAAEENIAKVPESDSEENKSGLDLNEFPAAEDDGDQPSN